jgi:hypothetical protein
MITTHQTEACRPDFGRLPWLGNSICPLTRGDDTAAKKDRLMECSKLHLHLLLVRSGRSLIGSAQVHYFHLQKRDRNEVTHSQTAVAWTLFSRMRYARRCRAADETLGLEQVRGILGTSVDRHLGWWNFVHPRQSRRRIALPWIFIRARR